MTAAEAIARVEADLAENHNYIPAADRLVVLSNLAVAHVLRELLETLAPLAEQAARPVVAVEQHGEWPA